ncbi:alkaline phosphatase D family protein [Sphingomonas montana]|uniref:alkaline phosphatase D family protein n=1 Tax=Sphingomonas montana TaxID=1843236 RepID=UPI00096DB1D8|nr:alkaline phosphatase D family protein [Sphingomonas montana]
MTLSIDRRLLVKASLLGLAALAVPGTAAILAARGFTHGVASGEPGPRSVLLWTRHVAANDSRLQCEVATDAAFTRIVGGGSVTARGMADHTAKIVIDGLSPDTWYHYRFIAPDGTKSPAGRTRTLPIGDVARFGIGLFSCSNMPFGRFNAYAHAAARDDLDLVVHVGDYIYEYGNDTYPAPGKRMPGREPEPAHEMVTLADYRLRHASYRADPDLLALHQRFPMIAQWDDHEFANDSWEGGAQNHQPATEGAWATRKAIAERVYREWMPVSDRLYDSFQIGTLATLFRPETRVTGRTKQLELAEAIAGRGDLARALVEFRDGPWSAPERTLMGMKQERWLDTELARSVSSGTRWQVLAQQLVMGTVRFPVEAEGWIPATAPEAIRRRTLGLAAASRAGLPLNLDAWDGYPAARSRLLRRAQSTGSNLVVLSGDSHNAWGNNLMEDGRPAGVEFAGHSVTSPGFEAAIPHIPPADVAKALRATNPGLLFADTARRGYVALTMTPEKVTGEWLFLKDIRTADTTMAASHSMHVRHGRRAFDGSA